VEAEGSLTAGPVPEAIVLRPLWVDLALTLIPLALAVGAWALGRSFARMPRWLAGVLLVVALLIVPLPLLRYVPAAREATELALHRLGGSTRLECAAALFLLGIAWAAPKKSLSPAFLGILATLTFLVFLTESTGRLWWRLAAPALWENRPDPAGCVTQTTGLTCASASAAMLLHHEGLTASEGELAYLSNTSLLGTTALDMADALRLKLDGTSWRPVVRRADFAHFQSLDRPFVAHVDLPGLGGHAVFVRAMSDSAVEVIDPRFGSLQKMPRADFEKLWDGSGLLLERDR
jgi:hypothetical protein